MSSFGRSSGCRELAWLPLRRSDGELRFLLIARQRDFSNQEMRMLSGFQRPLSALDSLVQTSVHGMLGRSIVSFTSPGQLREEHRFQVHA